MEILVTLQPRDDPNEVLLADLPQRQPLELRSTDSSPLILGRGGITGIADNSIGTSVIQISFDCFSRDEQSVRVTLLRDATKCRVHVNGLPFPANQDSTFLTSGDMISLDGLRYEYKIHISQIGGTAIAIDTQPIEGEIDIDDILGSASIASVPEGPQEPKHEPGVNVTPAVSNQLADEIQCSVCLEIQVNSRTIHPCGHSFCAVCIAKLKECPQCRVKINAHVPSPQLDSLISQLVSIRSLLDAEDVRSYHERKQKAKLFPAVDCTVKAGAKRRWHNVSPTSAARGPSGRNGRARAMPSVGELPNVRVPNVNAMLAFLGNDNNGNLRFHSDLHGRRQSRPRHHARNGISSGPVAVPRQIAIPDRTNTQIAIPARHQPTSQRTPQVGASSDNAISID